LAPIKRDAFEFFTALCTKYNYIKNLVQHQIHLVDASRVTKVITDNNVLLSISINNLNKKSYKLNDLLNIFSHWYQYDKSCENCGKCDILFKNELTLTKEIVIIRFNIFSLQDNKLVKISQKFNLSTIPTIKVLIAEQQYKVINAIFHHGSSIEQGHYTSMCREQRSLGLKFMMRKLRKSNGPEVLKIFTFYFYKKVLKKYVLSSIL